MDGLSGSMGVRPGKCRAKERRSKGHHKKLGDPSCLEDRQIGKQTVVSKKLVEVSALLSILRVFITRRSSDWS
jgi:hypothetical protein